MQVSLQRNGDQWFVVVPDEFVQQHELREGDPVHLLAHGQPETLITKEKPARKYSLDELLAEMPKEVPLVEGWDEMPSVGLERW